MSGPEYDPEFEAYLRRRVRLERRLHSLPRLEPPEELDRIIIGKAREAIQPPSSVRHFRAPKWAVPLGMAASLFMSLSLMLDVGLRQATHHDALSSPLLLEFPNSSAATAAEQAPIATAASVPDEAVSEGATALAEPSRVNSTRAVHPRMASFKAAPSARQAAATAPDTGYGARLPAPAASSMPAPAVAAAAAMPPAAAQAADSYASSHEEARARSAEMEPARGGYAPAPIRLAATPPEMETVVVVGTRFHQPAGSEAISAISVQSFSNFPDGGAREQPPAIPDLPGSLQAGDRSARSGTATNLAGSASPAAEAERREHPDPQAWLDHIEKMRAVGLSSAAEQEMRLFRDAYPAYPIP